MKAEHEKLVEKKAALKSALCAARGTVTKFDQIASFWQDIVLEPEEREQQERRRVNKATSSGSGRSGMSKSKSEVVVGVDCPITCGGQEQQPMFSSDDSSLLLSRQSLLLNPLVGENTPVRSDPDRRDRCDSVVDVLKQAPMMLKPMPKPIEINIDLDLIKPPLEEEEYAAAAAAVDAFKV